MTANILPEKLRSLENIKSPEGLQANETSQVFFVVVKLSPDCC